MVTPGKDKKSVDTPIIQHCPALAVASTDTCNQLSAIDQILPLERYVIPEGYNLCYFVVTKDGSDVANRTTMYVVSQNKQGSLFCKLARSANRVKACSAPMSESLAYTLSLSVIQAYLEATYQMWSRDQEAYPIYIIGDSQSALLAPQGKSY